MKILIQNQKTANIQIPSRQPLRRKVQHPTPNGPTEAQARFALDEVLSSRPFPSPPQHMADGPPSIFSFVALLFAADTSVASPQLSVPPGQQARLDAMKAKGPEASLAILPVMLVGRPFDRVTDVLGVMLETAGLQHIEIGRVPFTAGVKTEMPTLSVSLAAFLKTNSIATDYALYVELNGPTLDEAARSSWTSLQDGLVRSPDDRDQAFQALGTPAIDGAPGFSRRSVEPAIQPQ